MPFQTSKESESNSSQLPLNLLLSSSSFPSGASTLDDSSTSSSLRGSDAKMSRNALMSLLESALDIIDEVESSSGGANSSPEGQ
jgi:hypothetical protein